MADDRTWKSGLDRTRIDIQEDDELDDWSERLGVPPDRVKDAVKAVGPNVEAVEWHLAAHSPLSRSLAP